MSNEIKDIIDKIIETPLGMNMAYRYNNQVELSGFILRKPHFIKHDKTGVESCSLPLYQITNANGVLKIESFCCMVYVKDLVQQLKHVKKVLFVATMGKLRHHYKYGDYSQITEMETLAELKIDLANEWRKEE